MALNAMDRIKQETTILRRSAWTGPNKKIGNQEPNKTSPQQPSSKSQDNKEK
jgi:hypothetical protein